MCESGRKLPQSRQTIALLFSARGLADPVGHESDQPGGKLRHFLDELGKKRGREAQHAAGRDRASAQRELLHSGKGQYSGDISGFQIAHDRLAGKLAAPLKLALQQHEHGVGGRPLRRIALARTQVHLLRLGEEPGDLIVG